MTQIPPPTVDSLPKQFVAAMRTLFDIMDDKRTGYVKLTDIEHRWRDDRTRGLPKGVVESLQKVASHNGLLTFERFCAGLNMCLLKSQTESVLRNHDVHNNNVDNDHFHSHNIKPQMHRPPSAPLLDADDSPTQKCKLNSHTRGPESVHQHRTVSMPHLMPRHELPVDGQMLRYGIEGMPAPVIPKHHAYGPPKPPRAEKPPIDNIDILTNLHFAKGEHANLDLDIKDDIKSIFTGDPVIFLSRGGRGLGDGKPAAEPPPPALHKKPTRRREPRRHTLQNGIDYNVLKRMKQIEQEKDILVQGLSAVDKAREWYLLQLGEVQEKMRYASRMGTHVEQWTEAQQERLELQRARVLELNRQLAALADNWHRGGLSLHMNLALAPHTAAVPAHAANRLKQQNHLLTEEVTKKSERISVLEREKSALIRELLAPTNRNKDGGNVF